MSEPVSARGGKPVRVQRRRTKGWRMPENTIYVGRPSQWGNHYTVKDCASVEEAVLLEEHDLRKFSCFHPEKFEQWIAPLRGKNLACWCSLDHACHADVLLELSNPSNSEDNDAQKD